MSASSSSFQFAPSDPVPPFRMQELNKRLGKLIQERDLNQEQGIKSYRILGYAGLRDENPSLERFVAVMTKSLPVLISKSTHEEAELFLERVQNCFKNEPHLEEGLRDISLLVLKPFQKDSSSSSSAFATAPASSAPPNKSFADILRSQQTASLSSSSSASFAPAASPPKKSFATAFGSQKASSSSAAAGQPAAEPVKKEEHKVKHLAATDECFEVVQRKSKGSKASGKAPMENEEMRYKPRIRRWFAARKGGSLEPVNGKLDPEVFRDCQNLSKEHVRKMIKYHAFSSEVNAYCTPDVSNTNGISTYYNIPAQFHDDDGSSKYGFLQYAINKEGECYHRFFQDTTLSELTMTISQREEIPEQSIILSEIGTVRDDNLGIRITILRASNG